MTDKNSYRDSLLICRTKDSFITEHNKVRDIEEGYALAACPFLYEPKKNWLIQVTAFWFVEKCKVNPKTVVSGGDI